AVQKDDGAIVGRAEPDEDAVARFRREIEIAFVPDSAFVEHELGALGVPIARDLKAVGRIEIVFDQVALGLRLLVGAETAVGLGLIAIVVVTRFVGIDNGVPPSVEADALAGGGILDEVQLGGGGGGGP